MFRRGKFIFGCSLAAIAALTFFTWSSLDEISTENAQVYSLYRMKVQLQAQATAWSVANAFSQIESEMIRVTKVLQDVSPVELPQKGMQEGRRLRTLPLVSSIVFVATNGEHFAASLGDDSLSEHALRALVLENLQHWRDASIRVARGENGEIRVVLCRSILSRSAENMGVLCVVLTPNIGRIIPTVVGSGGAFPSLLVDSSGTLLGAWQAGNTQNGASFQTVYPFSQLPKDVLRSTGHRVYERGNYLFAQHKFENYPYFVLSVLDLGVVNKRLEGRERLEIIQVVIGGAILLLGLLFLASNKRTGLVEERKAIQEAERSRLTAMVRDIAFSTSDVSALDDALYLFLQHVCKYTNAVLGVARIVSSDRDESNVELVWYLLDGEDIQAGSTGIANAMNTEFVASIRKPLWMPDVNAYPDLFGASDVSMLGSGCIIPIFEGAVQDDLQQKPIVTLGLFMKEKYVDDFLVMEVVEQAGALLGRVVEQKRAGQILREQEQLYRGMFEGVDAVKMLVDPEFGRILDANTAACTFYGYSRSELLEKSLWQLQVSGESSMRPFLQRVIVAGGHVFETRQRTASSLRDVEVHAAPVELKGKPVVFLVIKDITERKKVEIALARSELQLRNIVEKTPVGLCMANLKGVLQFTNTAFCDLFGYCEEDLLDTHLSQIIAPRCKNDFSVALNSFVQEGQMVTREWEAVHSDDSQRTVLLNGALLTNVEGLPQMVFFVLDISERKQMEEMMIQSEKMASVGGLAAGMAHEINNPLGGILQGCQNIQRRLDPEMPVNIKAAEEVGLTVESVVAYLDRRKVLHFLAGVKESAERAARITSNMLDFSRRSESTYVSADLTVILDKALSLALSDYDLNKRYDFKRITIEREYADGLVPVSCIVTEVEQVVLNLVRNAAQAMGEMTSPPDTPTIKLKAWQEEGFAFFEVQDNGPGMPPHIVRKVFEPFFTTKKPGEGTGLGLSVSYFIITNNHRGTFAVNSQLGKGTTFTVSLPLWEGESKRV